MAAYASLLSLMNIVDTLQHHPRPPISLHIKQVESLTQKLTFLQQFLETYNPQLPYTTEADPLESRIADAAHAAEDVIESHIVAQITNDRRKTGLSDALASSIKIIDYRKKNSLYEALKVVIEEMALIETDAMEIKVTQDQLHTKSTPSDSTRSVSIAQKKSSMVGADDVLLQMKDKLTSDRRDRQIIPVVGMGGLGKTTLARTIYEERLVKEHFDICVWATVSQEYSIREIFAVALAQLNQDVDQNLGENELGDILYRHLIGRKYLIVMDDMWSIEAWARVQRFLPDSKNGSRIVVTTRLSNLASQLPNSKSLEMKLLDVNESWELLSKTVFGEEKCPLELEKIGKKIGKSCKGLPLSIAVVGGLLAKSKPTREFWESIKENLNSIVNLEDDERCLRLLHMSYKQLPIHLKPCFLYMGVFPEDEVIRASKLVKLWVAEGFLKPISGKSLEEAAELYLKDLIDRNLILIHELGSIGNIKKCKIHDLLRDLCLREAQKEMFYTLTPQGTANAAQRRIVISKDEDINALSSMSKLVRSLTLNLGVRVPPLLSMRLVRILNSRSLGHADRSVKSLESLDLVNSRFLAVSLIYFEFRSPLSIGLTWNLQTLIIDNHYEIVIDIWVMPRLRHVQVDRVSDPPNGQDDIVLGNLQTLETIQNFKCSQQVVKRIPNIKKLSMVVSNISGDDDGFVLNNLARLDKLESLAMFFQVDIPDSLCSVISFPHSLKKLTLEKGSDIMDKIGALPHLQKLVLIWENFKDGKWETSEGQFRSLKFLSIRRSRSLRVWTTESSHFPCLEQLLLDDVSELIEIPLEFAEVSTLRVIDVEDCYYHTVFKSAERILEEQEELYGEEAAVKLRYVWNEENW